MNNRNKRKIQILTILNNSISSYTSKEITDLTPVSLSCINALLKRYVKQGLLKREKINFKYFYEITEKGINRLEYLLEAEKTKDQDLLEREPVRLLD